MLLIPRLFHRIWLGRNPMPAEFRHFADTWRDNHPGWELREWNESNLPPLRNAGCLALARNYAQMSDVIRYELVFQFGGVYLDVDFVCQKNIEPLLDNLRFFAAGESPGTVSAGIFGAVPRHELVEAVIQKVPKRIILNGYQSQTTGPGMLTEVCRRFRDAQEIQIFGPHLFYPYAWNEKHRRNEAFPEAYAIHHWHGSWTGAAGTIRPHVPKGDRAP